MHTSTGSARVVSEPAGCGVMKCAESQAPATQADLTCHYDHLQMLLRQFKAELLAAQKQQLEQSLNFMSFDVCGSGIGANIPQVVAGKSPLRTSSSSATSSPAPSEVERRRVSQQGRDVWDHKEKSDASPHRTAEQEGERIMPISGAADAGVEQIDTESVVSKANSTATNKSTARHFKAYEIEQHVHVQARAKEADTQTRQFSDSLVEATAHLYFISRLESSCAKRIRSPAFDAMCGLLICFNAILVGVETEYLAQQGRVPKSVEVLQLILNSWYMAELLLRVYGHRCDFFFGEERNWNIFDTLLVTSAVVDLALANINIANIKTARILRVLRLFRIARTLRIIRTFKYVREFRKMVYSLMSSIQTLFWSLLLVFGVMYSFALWFTQSAAWYKAEHGETPDAKIAANIRDLNMYYSSFGRTTYTLFAAICGGYDWSLLVDPWISADEWTSCLMFFVFISIAVFGLMNIVTSVFVESAMHATRHFQDLLVDAKKRDYEMYMYHMERIFREIDKDDGGTISFREMRRFLNDSTSELPQYLEALGISSADVWVLFKLLDKDGSGNIDIGEFCSGCMSLKGEAKSFDINCLLYESRAMIKTHADFMEFVEDRFEYIELQLQQTLEFGKRVSMGHSVMMSKLDKASFQSTNSASDITEESLAKARSEPHTPPAPASSVLSPPRDQLAGLATFGVGGRRGVSYRRRSMYSTPRQAAANQPKSFAAGLSSARELSARLESLV